MPAVLSFHGAGGKANALVNLWRVQTEQSMILVIPTALETREGGNVFVSMASSWDTCEKLAGFG